MIRLGESQYVTGSYVKLGKNQNYHHTILRTTLIAV